jgi:hypothetical protein
MGAAGSLVAFFRSLGGATGVTALGAELSHHVATSDASRLDRIGLLSDAHQSHQIPELSTLPGPVRELPLRTTILRIDEVAAPGEAVRDARPAKLSQEVEPGVAR